MNEHDTYKIFWLWINNMDLDGTLYFIFALPVPVIANLSLIREKAYPYNDTGFVPRKRILDRN